MLAAFAALWLAPQAGSQAGQLDVSFGGDGAVSTQISPRGDFAAAIAIQADGKIVVGGVSAWNTGNPMFGLARYNPDGTLDASFGIGGS